MKQQMKQQMKQKMKQKMNSKCFCASCGSDTDICEMDNKGSSEWVCKECAFKLGGCEYCELTLTCLKDCNNLKEDSND